MIDLACLDDLLHLTRRLLTAPSPQEADALLSLPAHAIQIAPYRGVELSSGPRRHVGFVLRGMVSRYTQFRDGSRLVTALYLPGDFLGLDALLGSTAISFDALTEADILQIPAQQLGDAARDHPRIMEALWRISAADAAMTREWLVNVGGRPAAKRVAYFLCEMAWRLSDEIPAGACAFQFPLAQTHIGDMLSLTPVHVNRMLKRLQAQGLVSISKPLVTVPSWERLVAYAGFSADYLFLAGPIDAFGGQPVGSNANGAALSC
ncbi:MAG: Crp/Fnr family transcriptional regulator [Sphingomonadaceae bacterium]|nr:Crp/Fnr family transcriptional regulator [Sphingomonadaceae bacterium]